jgi:hypothetical protein
MIARDQRPQFLEAITAYARWCRQHRMAYHFPHDRWSAVGRRYVTLRDRTHTLARYDLLTGRILFALTRL